MAVRVETGACPIPGYKLIERLGGGGFGEVWKAEAPGGLLKAIKFVFGDLKSAGDDHQRADQELKALSRVKTVRHPFVLSLERYDIIDGQLMIVMELADRNLWDRFKECRAQGLEGIPREELLQYIEESAEALDLMNSLHQLQHLDIKPQNLFLVHNHVKVADFGLAKDLEGTQASVTGGVTPVYAAPETFDGYVSRFSDQYSLAIVYQELLTGRRPFSGGTVRQLILQHLQAQPDLSPLSGPDQAVIGRCLSKKPDNRFPNCREMARLLRANTPENNGSGVSASTGSSQDRAPVSIPNLNHDHNKPVEKGSNPGFDNAPALVLTPSSRPSVRTPAPRGSVTSSAEDPATYCIRGVDISSPPGQSRAAPKEVKGDGFLIPSVVIGLGLSGCSILQRLREILVDRFRSLDALPNLRTLLVDTDPEILRTATQGCPVASLSSTDVLLAGLNRPSYYLKPRHGKPSLEPWLKSRMLYRIPRSQITAGVRALGRLAFCDNYRLIVRRLQAEIEACVEPDALTSAARQTNLGIRSNRPRVYIVCGLAGGTGSGMFLDLAYTIRALLKDMGYEQPDVVGLFLLPPLNSNRTRLMALGNTYAALTELNHFGDPISQFKALYLENEPALVDTEPPFSRYFLHPLPDESDEAASRELVDLVGQFLLHDLCSPLGHAVDLARAALPAPSWQARGQFYGTFGIHLLASPQRALVRGLARQLCLALVDRWLNRDSKLLREPIQEWLQEQWAEQGLGADQFISRLREDCQEVLQREPEAVLNELIAPLQQMVSASPANLRRGAAAVELTAQQIADVLTQLEEQVGKPGGAATDPLPRLLQVLRDVTEKATNSWLRKMEKLPVHLIEDPAYRLAGAEEAIRNLVNRIEQVLQHHQPLTEELTTKAEQSYVRLRELCGNPVAANRRNPVTAHEVVELLRCFAKNRLQSQLLLQLAGAFISLRGHLSDELREISSCRFRLSELRHQFENEKGAGHNPALPVIGRLLLPPACSNVDQAVKQLLDEMTPEIMLDLDTRMQATIKQDFKGLVNICLSSANVLKNVEIAMLQGAREYADGLLEQASAAQLFLQQHPDSQRLTAEVAALFDEATPELASRPSALYGSLVVLTLPADEAGEFLRTRAQETVTDVEIHSVAGTDDVIVYRELTNVPLSDLPHLGPQGEAAYQQMNSADHFTPHSRVDIEFAPVKKG